MNSLIENLNGLGEHFLHFAWPMLWQSSLLIVVLLAFDFAARRRLRASIRYALWLVVLMKLCLPPTLALPTSPAWWLHATPPPIAAKAPTHYTVTYDNEPMPEIPQIPLPVFVPPRPVMNSAALILVFSAAVSLALLVWLLVRWWQIARHVRRAETSDHLAALASGAQEIAGRKFNTRVKLTQNPMSPAVCGLFRPVILLPRVLTEKLSPAQLHAVLLHEIFHLRRKDVWVNCAQALLQIFYWWHPLLWVANARIRRVREEAVDDAVMLALRDDADRYALTLLEVAKLAFRRPLMSLGLVGIMESRSALRQRIERLVDFRAPRRAGLTFLSLCGIFAFSAVALPMGEGPAPEEKQIASGGAAAEQTTLTVKVNPEIFIRNVKAQAAKTLLPQTNGYTAILLDLLRSEGVDCNPPHGLAFNTVSGEITTQNSADKLKVFRQVIEQLSRADGICELPLRNPALPRKQILIEGRIYSMNAGEFEKLTTGLRRYAGETIGAPWWSVPPEQVKPLIAGIEADGLQPLTRPRILTSSGMPASMFIGDDKNGIQLDCKPFAGDGFVDLTLQSTVISGAPDYTATNQIFSKASAENHGGIVLRMENSGGHAEKNIITVISVEIVTNGPARFQQRLVPLTKPSSAATASSAQELVGDGKLLFEMGKLDEAQRNLQAALASEPQNATAKYYLALIQTNRQNQKLVYTGPGRQQIIRKLQSIRLDHVSFDGLPLGQVLRELNEWARQGDDEHKGINFLINNNPALSSQPQSSPAIDPATGLPAVTATNASPDLMALPITIRPPLNQVTLGEVLDALVKAAPSPIRYSVQDFAIVFSAGAPVNLANSENLFTRTFKLDPNVLAPGPHAVGVSSAGNAVERLKSFFTAFGVNWETPKGKTAFYNEAASVFFVKATAEDLVTIQRAVRVLNQAQFQNASLGTPTNISGVLSDANFQNTLRKLQQRAGTNALNEPEVTTSSGRGINRIDSSQILYAPTRTNIVAKLDHIRLEKFSTGAAGEPLREVLAQLHGESKARDSERKGIDFIVDSGGSNTAASDDVGAMTIKIPELKDVRLADVLDAIVLVAEHPIKYGIRDSGVVFSAKDHEKPQLFARTFRVDPNTFYSSLRNVIDYNENKHAAVGVVNAYAGATNSGNPVAIGMGNGGPDGGTFVAGKNSSPTPSTLAGKFFTALGINLQEPPGKSVFYEETRGVLFVKATEADLDMIEQAIQTLNQVPPQLHIKARFFEVPKGMFQPDGNLHLFEKFAGASNSAARIMGILTATNARVALRSLQARSDIEVLGEPEVTTISGRQTQMRVTEVITVVTNMAFHDIFTNQDGTLVTNAIIPQTEKVETGPILDVVPYVLADGYTINLALIPSLTEFLGYDKSTNTTAAHNRAGEKVDVPQVLPRFTVRQVATTLNLWDGQTAIICGLPVTTYANGSAVTGKPKTDDKELLVFITASVVDPAGNLVHSEDELPFAQKGIPPQPPPPARPK